jgi:3-hydroxyisobutyrate dehydrogenase-like beta-hydroxyacid dehydrogenase
MTRIGLLFPGEMGAAVGAAARGDVVWASEGRSAETAARATAFRDVGSVDALVAESEIVLSICPPGIAEEVARQVAAAGFDGLYVEANAIAPRRAERIASDLGLRVVDGGIVAKTAIDLYLSGADEDVSRVAALFEGTEVVPLRLPGGIGAASALKMAFGGWNKIGVLLAAQAHAIAGAYGVSDALAAEGVPADGVVRAGPKAWRWAAEMHEIADTCAALDVPDGLGRAAAEVCARWDGQRGRTPGLDELLADLARGAA